MPLALTTAALLEVTPILSAESSLRSLVHSFTPLDWLLFALGLWSVIRGLRRGLVQELFSLLSIVAGLLVAAWNYPAVAVLLSRYISSPSSAAAAAFLLLVAITVVAVLLLGRLTRSAMRLIGLGPLDRLAGACFGLLRASLVGAAILTALTAFFPPLPAIRDSRLAPTLLSLAHTASVLTPPDLRHRLATGIARLGPRR